MALTLKYARAYQIEDEYDDREADDVAKDSHAEPETVHDKDDLKVRTGSMF